MYTKGIFISLTTSISVAGWSQRVPICYYLALLELEEMTDKIVIKTT